jgi:hypothetical protein
MATWVSHMRIAEHFMKKDERLNNVRFLVGNIGPDCGVPNEDWSAFTPDTNVTHWQTAGKDTIDADDFRSKYLKTHDEKYPFYLGYYFHLLTDRAWSGFFKRKKEEPAYAEGLSRDKNFIWTIKKDWYGQDHLFLRDHSDFVFYRLFAKIDAFPNEYFDFYPDNAFTDRIKYITGFYLSSHEDPDRVFTYLTKQEMDGFVEATIHDIENIYTNINISHQTEGTTWRTPSTYK